VILAWKERWESGLAALPHVASFLARQRLPTTTG
jgi:hypothetical protein